MEALQARGLEAVDATCRLVKRAQQVVKQLHEEGYQVVMIGDKDHPEVEGVVAYAPDVIIVDSEDEIDRLIPAAGKIGIVAQTTHAPDKVGRLIGYIAAKPFREIKIVNTLCSEIGRRQQAAIDLCTKVDVMFVLGGLHSANTRSSPTSAAARACRRTTWRTGSSSSQPWSRGGRRRRHRRRQHARMARAGIRGETPGPQPARHAHNNHPVVASPAVSSYRHHW